MRRSFFTQLLYTTVVIVLFLSGMAGAQESYDGTYQISELMDMAQDHFDLSREDAVFLLDSERRSLDMDGRWSTHIHRIIWIGTGIGIRRYGDHRINYDHDRCEFKDITVRTWRDGQWWITGETGIVETLPYSVRKAYDYTGLRDMMLLHDGIELPCILEIAFTVQCKSPDALREDGLWTFARQEPVVKARFELSQPSEMAAQAAINSGIIEELSSITSQNGLTLHQWEGGPISAARHLDSPHDALREPHLIWSTRTSWEELGTQIRKLLDSHATGPVDWADARDSLEENARSELELAQMVASYVGKVTRYVEIDRAAQWHMTRSASRIYETAYAHSLDRILLAVAMLQDVGFAVEPVFFAHGLPDGTPPSLSVFDGLGLLTNGRETICYYDPIQSRVYKGKQILRGKSQWRPGLDSEPSSPLDNDTEMGQVLTRFHLKYDQDSAKITGKAFISVDNCANPYTQIAGLDDQCTNFLSSVVGKTLPGAKVTSYNPSQFDEDRVAFGANIEIPKPAKDSLGRIRINFGDIPALIEDRLDLRVPLYIQELVSPIELVCPLRIAIQVHLDLDGLEVVYEPIATKSKNVLGDYSLVLDRLEDRLVIQKTLELRQRLVEPGEWSFLRDLLANAVKESGSLILVKEPN